MGGGSALEDVGFTVYVLAAIILAVIGWLIVKVFPVIRKFVAFVNDVAGEEARPGTPARPGLFERLSRIEDVQQDMVKKVDVVHHEMFPNSGKSLRDQNNRIEAKVSADYKEIGLLKEAVEYLRAGQENQQKTLSEHIEVSTGILRALMDKEK